MTTFAHSNNHYTNALSEEKNSLVTNVDESKSIRSGVGVKLIGSKQDYVMKGSNDLFKFIIVLDGHGEGNVVEKLKHFDWNKALIKHNERPDHLIISINEYLSIDYSTSTSKPADNFRDGSTCSIVKMYDTYIECYTIGDSQVGIKINDDYFYTINHDADNEEEVNRLKQDSSVLITDTWKGKVLNNNDLTMIKGQYFDFPNISRSRKDRLAVTRALGHNYGDSFSTLQEFEIFRIDYTKNDDVVIIAASDGLWDVVHDKNVILDTFYKESKAVSVTAAFSRLINRTENKWTQKWNYCWEGKIVEQTRFPNPDDIGIGFLVHI